MTNITKQQLQPCLALVENRPNCKKDENILGMYKLTKNCSKFIYTIQCLVHKNHHQQQQQKNEKEEEYEYERENEEALTPIQVKKIARLLKYCFVSRKEQYRSELSAKQSYCKKLHITTSSDSSSRTTIASTTNTASTNEIKRKRRRRRRIALAAATKKLLQMNAGKTHSSKTSTGKCTCICSCPCQIYIQSVVGYTISCSCSWHIWHRSEKYKKRFLLLTLNNNVGYRKQQQQQHHQFATNMYVDENYQVNMHVDDDDGGGIRKIITSHSYCCCEKKLFEKNTMLAPKCLSKTTTNTKIFEIATSTTTTIAAAVAARIILLHVKCIFRKALRVQNNNKQQQEEKTTTKVLLKENTEKNVKNAGFQKTKIIKELPINANNFILLYCKLLTSTSLLSLSSTSSPIIAKTTIKTPHKKLIAINKNNHHQQKIFIITSKYKKKSSKNNNNNSTNTLRMSNQIATRIDKLKVVIKLAQMSNICCTWKLIAFFRPFNKTSFNKIYNINKSSSTTTPSSIATIPQKSTIFIKSNNNNNSYDINKNVINIKNNKNGLTDKKECPEIERLNSQRDYDTSKYNREIFRFLTKSFENNNDKNTQNQQQQQKQQINNNNNKQNHFTNCNNIKNNNNNNRFNNNLQKHQDKNNTNLPQEKYKSLTCCTKQKPRYRYSFTNYHKCNRGTTSLSFLSILFLSFFYFATANTQQLVTNALTTTDVGGAPTPTPQVTLTSNEKGNFDNKF